MSTRSDIIVQCRDGKWRRIYCHFDGYLEHNGRLLAKHYATQENAEALVTLGDLSCLGEEIGEKHDFDYRSKLPDGPERKRVARMCLAYGRDRGETGTAADVFDSLPKAWPERTTWTEYTYVWTAENGDKTGRWYVGDPDEGRQTLLPLEGALNGGPKPLPDIKAPWGVIGTRGKDHSIKA